MEVLVLIDIYTHTRTHTNVGTYLNKSVVNDNVLLSRCSSGSMFLLAQQLSPHSMI